MIPPVVADRKELEKSFSSSSPSGNLRRLSAALCALAIYMCMLAGFYFGPPKNASKNLSLAIQSKHARLHGASGPKIVFVGGSNVSYGVDTEKLSSLLNRECINMGLGASVGLRYQLQEIRNDIKSGDLIVISPEYDYFCQTSKAENNARVNGSNTLLQVIEAMPAAIQWVTPVYLAAGPVDFLDDVHQLVKLKWKKYKSTAEEISNSGNWSQFWKKLNFSKKEPSYNSYGDYIAHLNKTAPGIGDNQLLTWEPFAIDKEGLRVMADFASFAANKGARVVVLPPPMPENSWNKDRVQEIWNSWQTVSGVKVIAAPQRYTFPTSDFFDTCYHLNKIGRVKRAELIREDVSNYLSSAYSRENL